MFQINEDIKSKEQRKPFPISKIGFTQEKAGNTYEVKIRLLFLMALLLFSINVNISPKFKDLKTKDIALSFDFYYRINDDKIEELTSERNYLGPYCYKYQNNVFNPLLFLYSTQIDLKQYKIDCLYNTYLNQHYSQINNIYYFFFFVENFVFMKPFGDKYSRNKFETLPHRKMK